MLLVVFGAGASYDSVHHLPAGGILPAVRPALEQDHPENDRLPLANQLFDTRPRFMQAMQDFPECREVIPLLRKPEVRVEQELGALRDQADRFPRAHQELAAILFYLHAAISECQRHWFDRHRGINNYVTFVRELERWRFEAKEQICFVTFNYDTMLEEAMSQVLGSTFDSLENYLFHNQYTLIKLHGSINWAREIEGMRPASTKELISAAADLVAEKRISNRFRIVGGHRMVLGDGSVGYPALSIPVERKDDFACPEAHVQILRQLLPKVTMIITVGWRAMEADFLSMLRENRSTGRELLIVSGDEKGANETLTNLKRSVREVSIKLLGETIVPNGFTGLINNLGYLNSFLRRPRPEESGADD